LIVLTFAHRGKKNKQGGKDKESALHNGGEDMFFIHCLTLFRYFETFASCIDLRHIRLFSPEQFINSKISGMKKILFIVSLSAMIFSMIISCKKDVGAGSNSPDPNVTYITSGLLCTRGSSSTSSTTLSYYFDLGSGDQMWGYVPGNLRPEDEVSVTANSNGSVTIKKKKAYVYNGKSYSYFAIEKNASPGTSPFPNNAYLFSFLRENTSAETEFIIQRNAADGTKFSIESKIYPGYYLGTAKWANATSSTESRLVFTTRKQEFFFKTQ
jgi:hypothetical protein